MIKRITLLALLFFSISAFADVTISNAWVRDTKPGQDVGAAYMTLKSPADTQLIKVESQMAGTVEIHEMSMNNGVMKMRMLDTLALPANKAVELSPGGFHLMLFDMKKPFVPGTQVDMVLTFKGKAGKTFKQKITVPVKTAP
ncbi:MAG TPA: copper chaperone PCu(A)C [Methylophilaceae bacterium]